MKVVFISAEVWSSYNPEGIVARKILNGLLKAGHEVDVITIKEFDYANTIVFSNNIPEILDKVLKNVIGLEKMIFVIKAYQFLKKQSNNYDVIITRSEPISLHLINLWLNNSVKKIAMFSDVGYLSPYYGKYHFLKKIVSFILEKKLTKKVDIITHTNSFVIDKYVEEGFNREKFHVFPNPLEIDSIGEFTSNERNGKIHLAYTGSLYGDRNPDKLFSYLSEQKDRNFVLYLIGAVRNMYYEKDRFGKAGEYLKSKELEELHTHIARFGLQNNVKVLPFMTKQELVSFIYSNVDILVNIDAVADINLFLSSKVVDYLQYRLPILNISTQGASVSFLNKVGVLEYMDYRKEFRFTLQDILNSGLFIPDMEKIDQFSTKNLCKEILHRLNDV